MSLTKLSSIGLRLTRRNLFSQRFSLHESMTQPRFQHGKSVGGRKNNPDDDDEEMDQPIKYSTSKAARWDPTHSRMGEGADNRPWFQGWVVMASTASFLIYFCMLREENDIDDKLRMNLSDHFEGERKANLEASQRIALDLSEGIIDRR